MVKKEPLLEWLDKNNLALVWNVYGEKQIVGDFSRKEEYIGRLNLSGLYTHGKDGNIEGILTFEEE